MYRLLTLCLILLATPVRAMDIEVRALFGGAALLIIDGDRQFLKEGETSPQGLELVSASSEQVVVRVDGSVRTLQLSERIAGSFEQADTPSIQIRMRDNRQYMTAGTINGRSVQFLVDTGANVVALNQNLARSLGISLDQAIPVPASTASDDMPVLLVNLREVSVGPITRNNIQAVVVQGDNPKNALLGMSFLQHVEISETNGLMTLKARF